MAILKTYTRLRRTRLHMHAHANIQNTQIYKIYITFSMCICYARAFVAGGEHIWLHRAKAVTSGEGTSAADWMGAYSRASCSAQCSLCPFHRHGPVQSFCGPAQEYTDRACRDPRAVWAFENGHRQRPTPQLWQTPLGTLTYRVGQSTSTHSVVLTTVG